MAYIGQGIKQGTFKVLDTSGNTYNGSNTTFSLGTHVGAAAQLLVSHDGVIQLPGTDYTLASGGASITFTTAPASGASIFIVEISGAVGGTVTPSDNSVGITQLNVSDGSNGQALTTDGSGTLSFASAGATLSGSTNNTVVTVTGANAMQGEANLTFDGSNLDLADGNITNVGTVAADRVLGDAASDSYIDFPGSDVVTINTGDNIRFRIDDSGKLSSGGETSPDVTKGGITLNQAQFDDFILTFKSSDVAHATTNEAEADTFLRIAKYIDSTGGAAIVGYTENQTGIYLQGHAANADTSKGGSSGSNIIIKASKNSGSGFTSHGSNENLATIANHNNPKFIFDAEGDFHADNSSTTFDAYDDAQLVRAYDLSHGKGVINSKFDKFVTYNHEKLADLRLVGRENDGTPNHFVNIQECKDYIMVQFGNNMKNIISY